MTVVKRRIRIAGKSRTFTGRQGWRDVGDKRIFFRSDWEFQYAKHLQILKEHNAIKNWEHEPQTFWFKEILRGTRSYLPDFKVTASDGSHYWVEVKGYMDRKSRTKIKRFNKYYPNERLVIVGKAWFGGKNPRVPAKAKRKGPLLEKTSGSLSGGEG